MSQQNPLEDDQPSLARLLEVQRFIAELDEVRSQLESKKEEAQKVINRKMRDLHQLIDKWEARFLDTVNETIDEKIEGVTKQQEKLKSTVQWIDDQGRSKRMSRVFPSFLRIESSTPAANEADTEEGLQSIPESIDDDEEAEKPEDELAKKHWRVWKSLKFPLQPAGVSIAELNVDMWNEFGQLLEESRKSLKRSMLFVGGIVRAYMRRGHKKDEWVAMVRRLEARVEVPTTNSSTDLSSDVPLLSSIPTISQSFPGNSALFNTIWMAIGDAWKYRNITNVKAPLTKQLNYMVSNYPSYVEFYLPQLVNLMLCIKEFPLTDFILEHCKSELHFAIQTYFLVSSMSQVGSAKWQKRCIKFLKLIVKAIPVSQAVYTVPKIVKSTSFNTAHQYDSIGRPDDVNAFPLTLPNDSHNLMLLLTPRSSSESLLVSTKSLESGRSSPNPQSAARNHPSSDATGAICTDSLDLPIHVDSPTDLTSSGQVETRSAPKPKTSHVPTITTPPISIPLPATPNLHESLYKYSPSESSPSDIPVFHNAAPSQLSIEQISSHLSPATAGDGQHARRKSSNQHTSTDKDSSDTNSQSNPPSDTERADTSSPTMSGSATSAQSNSGNKSDQGSEYNSDDPEEELKRLIQITKPPQAPRVEKNLEVPAGKEYFFTQIKFLRKLIDVSRKLGELYGQPEAYKPALDRELEALSVYISSGFACLPNANAMQTRVLRFFVPDCHPIPTYGRVLYKMIIEVVDLPAHYTKELADEYLKLNKDFQKVHLSDSHSQPSNTSNGPSSPAANPSGHSTSAFGDSWKEVRRRLKGMSEFSKLPHWDVRAYIVKHGDLVLQEQFVMQLLVQFQHIWHMEGVPLKLCCYKIFATSYQSGLIEVVPNSISLDKLKKSTESNGTPLSLLQFFKMQWPASEDFKRARSNFVSSLAAYSVICYLLQIKDRHNGNIMLDAEGYIFHIDFGYLLARTIKFEKAPFKLTDEFIELMGGDQSKSYKLYCNLCVLGFLAARKHFDKIQLLVEMSMGDSTAIPCLDSNDIGANLNKRFHLDWDNSKCEQFILGLIGEARDNWRTQIYDTYQRIVNDIHY